MPALNLLMVIRQVQRQKRRLQSLFSISKLGGASRAVRKDDEEEEDVDYDSTTEMSPPSRIPSAAKHLHRRPTLTTRPAAPGPSTARPQLRARLSINGRRMSARPSPHPPHRPRRRSNRKLLARKAALCRPPPPLPLPPRLHLLRTQRTRPYSAPRTVSPVMYAAQTPRARFLRVSCSIRERVRF